MAFAYVQSPACIIPNGLSTSNVLSNLDDCWAIGLTAPATLSGTITVEVEPTSTGIAFVTLQSGGLDVSIAASKAIVLSPFPFRQLRLVSTAAEGADRTFSVLRIMPT